MKKTIVKIYREKIEIKNPNKHGDFSLLSSIKKSKIYLLFAEDVSYVFQATIPSKLKKLEEKQYILDLVTKHIPEDLNNHIWGYKILGKNKEKKHIVIFSPVKEVYEKVKSELSINSINVMRFETSQIARLFGQNDFEGIQKEKNTSLKFENIFNQSINQKKLGLTKIVNFKFILVWLLLTISSSALGSLFAFFVFFKIAS